MFEKVIHQKDTKNERLLLSASFKAKFEIAFVLIQENTFSYRFHFTVSRKSKVFSKNGTRDF